MKGKYITVNQLRRMKKYKDEGYSIPEIADLMGLSDSAVYNHLPVGNKAKPKVKQRKHSHLYDLPPPKHYSVSCNLESHTYIHKIARQTGATRADIINEIIRKHKSKWWQL